MDERDTVATVLRAPSASTVHPAFTALLWGLGLAASVLIARRAAADGPDGPEGPAGPDPVLLDFEPSDKQVVEAAAKTRTTITEAPFTVTVITEAQIRNRGFRTLSDVLRTVPGFDAGRSDLNGQSETAVARGAGRTVLVMVDGVSVVDPTRDGAVLDERLPLSVVRRIEITSGPGSVLWGSHALLGVVNVITSNADSHAGLTVTAAAGGGPGAPGLGAVALAYGARWFDRVDVFGSVGYRTTRAPALTLDEAPIATPLWPAAPDGPWRLAEGSPTVDTDARRHTVTTTGQVRVGPVTAGWYASVDRRPLSLGPSGAILDEPYTSDGVTAELAGTALITTEQDSVVTTWLRYVDALSPDVDLAAQLSYAWFELGAAPLGLLPVSDVYPAGRRVALESSGSHRGTLNVDVTARLPFGNRLIGGGELFVEASPTVTVTGLGPGIFGPYDRPEPCPSLGPTAAGLTAAPCGTDRVATESTLRVTGGLYLTDEWRASDWAALNAGVRAQGSTGAGFAVLTSVAAVFEPTAGLFLKTMYAEGVRPPDVEATDGTSDASPIGALPDPSLPETRSRAIEGEVSGSVVSGDGAVREWYGRLGYSYTVIDDLVVRDSGQYRAADRRSHTLEALTRLSFRGGHDAWASYSFMHTIDPARGRVRSIPNHVLSLGGRYAFWEGRLGLGAVLTVRGKVEDLNRTLSQPAQGVAGNSSGPGVTVAATGLEVTEIDTSVQLRLGVDARNLFGHMSLALWVDNALDDTTPDADLDFDARTAGRPLPTPGISLRAEATVTW